MTPFSLYFEAVLYVRRACVCVSCLTNEGYCSRIARKLLKGTTKTLNNVINIKTVKYALVEHLSMYIINY